MTVNSQSQHVVPVKVYVAVFVTLLVMTAATTAISGIDLGPWNTVVALGIAVFKASLVVLFFMHARYSPRLTHMVILAGLFWLVLLLLITFSDFASRGWLT
ncbi:MAG TPA: cytochrome C oxidase subunit IV family protein [Thermoanaerobaculia bacterium]|nr:cytochrome C oxidase subunit IV family protein [Thermoanaerobaculia bacterium]